MAFLGLKKTFVRKKNVNMLAMDVLKKKELDKQKRKVALKQAKKLAKQEIKDDEIKRKRTAKQKFKSAFDTAGNQFKFKGF